MEFVLFVRRTVDTSVNGSQMCSAHKTQQETCFSNDRQLVRGRDTKCQPDNLLRTSDSTEEKKQVIVLGA